MMEFLRWLRLQYGSQILPIDILTFKNFFMKTTLIFVTATSLILLTSCEKDIRGNQNENASNTTLQLSSTSASTSKGSGSGGGGATTAGFISFVGGTFKLIGGNADSIQINMTQPAPAGGWVLNLSSSTPSFQIPATFLVPAGVSIVHVPVTSSEITSTKSVTITAKLLGQTKSSPSFDMFPLHATFPAPKPGSPGNGAGFKNRLQVKFSWSDNANAYYQDLQISDHPSFAGSYLDEVYLDDPIWAQSYFNGLGRRYWRVRYIDGSGAPGPWSEVRNFEIKP